ncbi:MAG: phenylalanine--tRNA ligase beta subunit-related protein [Candidatus Bathyarchaeia archaeon]
MKLIIDGRLKSDHPGLSVLLSTISGVTVKSLDESLEAFKGEVLKKIRTQYKLESLKDEPVFRAYRDFFWNIGVDPTKIRPAAEALVRRALLGKPIPTINTLVDAYNLASMETGIALAAFDRSKISGDLIMRYARPGESFQGIGMTSPIILRGIEVVISDGEKLVAIYPYRDADSSKIVESTKSLILLACGVPGIDEDILKKARDTATSYIERFCGGEAL